ncbi:MAG: BMP family ABC transporter substrate-binding protein [Anaerolineae bacterium]|nr:BMP family ABC transporter substrate-binding protein [Anaerolineae bacterium]
MIRERERKQWKPGLWVFVALLLILAACNTNKPSVPQSQQRYRVVFLYLDEPETLGWVHEHDRARQFVEEQLGDEVETAYVVSAGNHTQMARVIRRYAQEGYDMIFATSSEYMDAMYEVAQEFPNIKFEHCSGTKTHDNMATYSGRMYQSCYLSGIVAGKMTQNNFVGYVASDPRPEVIQELNAFTLGARSVNPSVEVRVIWTGVWNDPEAERESAAMLLDQGADIIAQHQDSTEPQKVSQEHGALSIGYNSNMRTFVGDTVLTSPIWNWGPYYATTIQSAIDGKWSSHQYWGGLKEGVVTLSEYSPKVPQDVRDLVKTAFDDILGGRDVFCGPIRDQNGYEIVAAGTCMNDADLVAMKFLVEGVIGSLPEE